MKNEMQVFNFSEAQTPIRSVVVDSKPYFVASDVAKALGYTNERKAVKDHCRCVTKRDVPHPQSADKTIEVNVIPQGDIYRLIVKSQLPSAQKFESWIFDEVIPSIMQKGYYNMYRPKDDYIDARDVVFHKKSIQGFVVRYIEIDGSVWVSILDLHRAIGCSTSTSQTVKKLNVKQTLARKIWLFGSTNPGWFANELGCELIVSGSRVLRKDMELKKLLP